MENTKKCSGCKETMSLNQFYKNKLVLDGHSNYCISCTKENSKKYFKRKKDKLAKAEDDNLMKMVLLSSYPSEIDSANADNIMRVLMIEKMCKSIINELSDLKKSLTKSENIISQ